MTALTEAEFTGISVDVLPLTVCDAASASRTSAPLTFEDPGKRTCLRRGERVRDERTIAVAPPRTLATGGARRQLPTSICQVCGPT